MGRRPKGGRIRAVVRAYCVYCMGDDAAEPVRCPSVFCELWPWRRAASGPAQERPQTPAFSQTRIAPSHSNVQQGMVVHQGGGA